MKTLPEILSEATPEQLRSWMVDFERQVWPETMPVPQEAISVCWHKVMRKAISLNGSATMAH